MEKKLEIVFLDAATVGDSSLDPIRECGHLVTWPTSTPEEALARVRDCNVLIINKIAVNQKLIDAAPHLQLICEAATGVNNIDLDYAASKGIPVKNVAAYSTDSVVQVTFMMMLALAGQLRHFDSTVKSKAYSRSGIFTDVTVPYMELAGKTIGIIGMGNIGHKVADVASALGMKVVYYSTSGTGHCTDFPCLGIRELLEQSDVVSIHAPLNDRTRGLLGAEELGYMKKTAFLLNMGRGGIVDEAALAAAVDAGEIAGAGLDVFVQEPLPEEHPLLRMQHPERVVLTPHIGWASAEARERLIAAIGKNIASTFA